MFVIDFKIKKKQSVGASLADALQRDALQQGNATKPPIAFSRSFFIIEKCTIKADK
jgi:hypothetical protein